MDKFEASNGVTVKRVGAGIYVEGEAVRLDRLREKLQAGSYGDVTPAMQDALREFFQHERDEENGRWRWPDNPDYVVKHDPLGVRIADVLHEPSFAARVVRPSDEMVGLGSPRDLEFLGAARAYFEAHPERKPWHDAKTGEIWVITDKGEESAWTVNSRGFLENRGSIYEPTNPGITAARRIWPESD